MNRWIEQVLKVHGKAMIGVWQPAAAILDKKYKLSSKVTTDCYYSRSSRDHRDLDVVRVKISKVASAESIIAHSRFLFSIVLPTIAPDRAIWRRWPYKFQVLIDLSCPVKNPFKRTGHQIALLWRGGEYWQFWLHSFMNRQYDRGSPIKILHKYPEKDPASTAKALWHEVIAW